MQIYKNNIVYCKNIFFNGEAREVNCFNLFIFSYPRATGVVLWYWPLCFETLAERLLGYRRDREHQHDAEIGVAWFERFLG